MPYSIILTTCPNDAEAKQLASKLIEKKLAACVQLSAITSYYTWKNELCVDPEVRLVIKTREHLYPSVEKCIKTHHSYDVPQIIQTPITEGAADYLDWIGQHTSAKDNE